MADIITCPIGDDICNCLCNCQAFLSNNRQVTVGSLEIEGNEYTFNYTMTNSSPAISFVVFCINCPNNRIEISSSNTTIVVTGNPNGSPVTFTECFTPGCQSETLNSFYVDFDVEVEECCRYQGIKIEINPAEAITEILFQLTFTLPEGVNFGFNPGNLKIKSGVIFDIVNDLCMPGCLDACNMANNICNIWQKEKDILESNKDVFIHFAQLVLPSDLDLSTITVEQLENKIRAISKLEKSAANIICNIAKILDKLNNFNTNGCYSECTLCNE